MFHELFRQQRNILGLNSRALHYLLPLNKRGRVNTNDKLETKKVLAKLGITVPRTFGIIRDQRDAASFPWSTLPTSFALKPNYGFGGSGIIVIFGKNKKGLWVRADGTTVDVSDIREQVSDILDGRFSIGNIPDIAFFEERVHIIKDLKPYAIGGIPDVRVLVANMVPVMAMLRLPTRASRGRSNLHAGGICVGIDLGTGRTTSAYSYAGFHDMYPETRLPLRNIAVPHFHDILRIAARAAMGLGLGYVGVDIAIDREEGPLVLEVNSKPGPAIQLANRSTLRDRLRRIEDLTIRDPEHAVDIALSLFSEPNTTRRKMIGVEEFVEILDRNGERHQHLARIDTGAYRTSIDRKLAEQYGLLYEGPLELKKTKNAIGYEERPIFPLRFILSGQEVATEASVSDRRHLKHVLLIGRRDLGSFLIDPSREHIHS